MVAMATDIAVAQYNSTPSGNISVTVSSGTFNIQSATTGGGTPIHYLSAASTNSNNVKGSAGTIYEVTAINTTSTIYYLKLYDKATAPTCGTDTPVHTYPIPVNSTNGGGFTINFSSVGLAFANGIGFCLTGAIADNDATNAATGVAMNFSYK